MSKLIGKIKKPEIIKCDISNKNKEINVKINNGARGKSAYELWIEAGNNGSIEDFLNSLKASEVDYEYLDNKPTIEDVELVGNRTFEDLGVRAATRAEIKRLF